MPANTNDSLVFQLILKNRLFQSKKVHELLDCYKKDLIVDVARKKNIQLFAILQRNGYNKTYFTR